MAVPLYTKINLDLASRICSTESRIRIVFKSLSLVHPQFWAMVLNKELRKLSKIDTESCNLYKDRLTSLTSEHCLSLHHRKHNYNQKKNC